MGLDLGADAVGTLVSAFLGRATAVGVLGTLAVLLVSGWRPGGPLPRRLLLAPVVVAAVASTGQIRVGQLDVAGRVWLLLLVLVVAAAGPRTTALRETSATGPLLLLTALGLFACLPETSGAITLVTGVAVTLALAPRATTTRLVLALLPVGVGLVVAADGIRAGQIVGGVVTLGMLLVLPLAALVPGVDAHLRTRLRTAPGLATVLVTQVLVVVFVARGPGIRLLVDPGGYAAPAAIALLGLAVLAHLPDPGGRTAQAQARRKQTPVA